MSSRLKNFLFLIVLAGFSIRYAVRYGWAEAREEAVDFPTYYYAAALAFDMDTEPYSRTSWSIARAQYPQGELYPFLYSPPSLVLFRLFNGFNYETAKRVMLGLNHFLGLAFLPLFFYRIHPSDRFPLFPLLGILYFYNYYPFLLNIYTGQINLLILVITCLAWVAVKDGWHPFWIGLFLSVGIILKLYPAVFLAVLFFRREYKSIIFTGGILAGLSLTATAMLPPGIWNTWFDQVALTGYLKEIAGIVPGRPTNQSINGFLYRLFLGYRVRFEALLSPPAWVVQLSPYVLCGLVVLLTIGASGWLSRKGNRGGLDLQFSLWLLAMFMIAPLSWSHHLVLLVPAVYVAFSWTLARRWHAAIPGLMALAVFLASNFNVNNPAFYQGWSTLILSAKLWAVGSLWLYLLVLAFSSRGPLEQVDLGDGPRASRPPPGDAARLDARPGP